jgi:EmrB/QacA subfamily drug resistance transporter
MPELSSRRRQLILAICCMSVLLVGMDNTIVNVALPSIRDSFHASIADLQWTIDAYTVTLASLLILAGSMADRLGRRRTFQTGLIVFGIGSLLCSLAPGLKWLVAFRMLQAVGGSMLNPVAMSIISNVFTDASERARAIGMWAGVVGISFGIGPVVGGALTDSIGWRAIFWINVPIALAAFVLAAVFVPESRAGKIRRVDLVGQILVIGLLSGVTFAIIEVPRTGFSVELWSAIALAVVCAVALGTYEPRRKEPLIQFGFFRSIPFSSATLTAVCAFGSFSGFLFLNTLYLQAERGLAPFRAGLMTAPMAIMLMVFAPLSGRVVGSRGPRVPLLIAGIFMAGGALMLSDANDKTNYAWLIFSYLVFAFGFGFVNPPITNTAVSGMPRDQAGVAAALASTSRQTGGALGIAVIGSIVNAGSGGSLAGGIEHSSHAAWLVITVAGAAIAVLGLLATTRHAQKTAQTTAEKFNNRESAPAMADV